MKKLTLLLAIFAFSLTLSTKLSARQYAIGSASICKPANGYFDFNLSDSAIPKNLLCVNGGWVLYRPNGEFTAVKGDCQCSDEKPNVSSSTSTAGSKNPITLQPDGSVLIDAPKVVIKGSLYLDGRMDNGLDRVADLHLNTNVGMPRIYFGQMQNGVWLANAIEMGDRSGEDFFIHTNFRNRDGSYTSGDLTFSNGVLKTNREGEVKGKAYIEAYIDEALKAKLPASPTGSD